MRRLLVLPAAAAVFATGLGIGVFASEGDAPQQADAATAVAAVLVRTKDGGTRELSAAEAAARIERLEALVERASRARAAPPDAEEETTEPTPPSSELPDVPIPKRGDGKTYAFAELRDLAKTATDRALRLSAIRALRRDTSPEARAVLGEVLADTRTPAELRVEAAKALAKPPHRDAAPEELVKLLGTTELPSDVRRELAEGVVHLRDRGAWMLEIALQMTKETDTAVRALLFDSVQRSAWDPAAKTELLALTANTSASLDERRLAAQALARLGNDRGVFEALSPLLAHTDAGLREAAVQALARSGRLSLDQIGAALGDGDASVRAAALLARLPQGKNVPKEQRDAAIATAVRLATEDPDASVRRTALGWTGSMAKETAAQVLETARSDRDPLVRLEAYQHSGRDVVRTQADRVLAELESPDVRVREAAYRVLARKLEVDVPYRAQWNEKARAAAVAAIRQQVATR